MLYRILLLSLFTIIFYSCDSDRLLIPVPDESVSIEMLRVEQEFSDVKSASDMKYVHENLKVTIPDLYAYYLGVCLKAGRMEDSTVHENLLLFLEDPYMIKVHKQLSENFEDLSEEVNEINEGMNYLKYYFPNGTLPKYLVTYNSAFSNSVVSSPLEIGIGLERYLGGDNELIKELPEQVFFQYIKDQMERKFLSRDVMMSWLGTHYFSEIDDNTTIAEQLVEWGKLYYVVEATLPRKDKDIILRYTPEDMDWAMENENAFWKYLVEENTLFKRDHKIARNIFGDGPFTPGLPIDEKAPPRLGHFLGWRMVKNFMDSEKDVTIEELANVDYKKILKSYKID